MTQTALIVAGIALADALNPSTVIPAVYLSGADSPARRVFYFGAGVFLVSFVGGALILLGPGQVAIHALPHPSHGTKHVAAILTGLALIAIAIVLWLRRVQLAENDPPGLRSGGRSTFAAGAALMLVELPTAFPMFAAIAVIVGAHSGSIPLDLGLVALFNFIFVLPVLAIAIVIAIAPRTRTTLIAPAANWLGHHWPVVFALIALAAGLGLVVYGLL